MKRLAAFIGIAWMALWIPLGALGTVAHVPVVQGVAGGTPIPVSGTVAVTGATTGTPGDAFATPGAIDQVQTFPQVFNGTTWDLLRSAGSASLTAGTGLLGAGTLFQNGSGVWESALGRDIGGRAGLVVFPSDATTATAIEVQNYGNTDANTGTRNAELVSTYPMGFNGASWDRNRAPITFKTANATASGNTALWTPTTGKKFRLMRYQVIVTDNATQTTPGTLTFSLNDSGTTMGQIHPVFVPAVGLLNSGSLYSSPWIDLGNGILSGAANNVLQINLTAALTAGQVTVNCCGTEE